jgi:hypothetical protein
VSTSWTFSACARRYTQTQCHCCSSSFTLHAGCYDISHYKPRHRRYRNYTAQACYICPYLLLPCLARNTPQWKGLQLESRTRTGTLVSLPGALVSWKGLRRRLLLHRRLPVDDRSWRATSRWYTHHMSIQPIHSRTMSRAIPNSRKQKRAHDYQET